MKLPTPKIRKGRRPKDLIRIGNYTITEREINKYRSLFKPEYVYCIKCPLSKLVIYVGKTEYPEYRKDQHFRGKQKSLVGRWIKAMISIGQTPIFEIIDSTYWDALVIEQYYIYYYKSIGQAFFNINGKCHYFKARVEYSLKNLKIESA